MLVIVYCGNVNSTPSVFKLPTHKQTLIKLKIPMKISQETVRAAERKTPKDKYLELFDQPEITTPYTSRDTTAKNKDPPCGTPRGAAVYGCRDHYNRPTLRPRRHALTVTSSNAPILSSSRWFCIMRVAFPNRKYLNPKTRMVPGIGDEYNELSQSNGK